MIAPRQGRILHLVGYAERGGCERCCEVFIRYSRELAHEVVVFGETGPMTPVWTGQGAPVRHLALLRSSRWSFYRRLQSALRETDFDHVILWAGIRVPLVLAALARFDRPVVLHAGNPFAAHAGAHLYLQASRLLPRPRRAIVVACSAHVAATFRRAPYYRDMSVTACLNPVEAPPANPHRARPLGADDRIRIGMVARLDPIKDHAALLRAFRELRRSWPKAELHLAGDGPLRLALATLAENLGLAPAVTFHGALNDVVTFLRRLDLFVYFTTSREGMGVALAEALAQGLPSVVNDLPVMREVGGEGAACGVHLTTTGSLDAAQAMDGLLRDVCAREALSARAHARAHGPFAPRAVAERYLSLLEVSC